MALVHVILKHVYLVAGFVILRTCSIRAFMALAAWSSPTILNIEDKACLIIFVYPLVAWRSVAAFYSAAEFFTTGR